MTTRLKIDWDQGILEVEGSETFVKAIYHDFKAQFLGEEAVETAAKPPKRRRSRRAKTAPTLAPQAEKVAEPVAPAEAVPVPPAAEPVAETKAPVLAQNYDFLKDLDLAATPDHPSLVEFMDAKFPITNEERNLVFAYYLQYVIKEKPITPDYIYTCYRKAKIRAPLDLAHSLHTTADHQKWLKIARNGHITVTADGQRYLEQQLPKKLKGKIESSSA